MHSLLGKATSRIIYDIDRFRRTGEPPFAATIVRETHNADLKEESIKTSGQLQLFRRLRARDPEEDPG